MITYCVVIIAVVFLCYIGEKCCARKTLGEDIYIYQTRSTRICMIIVTSVLAITAGCRYHVGTDYKSYIALYNFYAQMSFEELVKYDEPLLPIIGNLCSQLFGSYKSMFFVVSLLSIGLALRKMYQETTNFVLVTLLYIFVGCWHGTFNGIRQYLACTIIFLGYKYIVERQLVKYVLVCLLAFLCHKSAIIFIVLYFMYSKKISTLRIVVVFTLTIIISQNYEWIFEAIGWMNDSEFVMTEYSARSVSSLRVLVGCCPAILALYIAYTRKLNETQVFYVYMLVANAATRLMTSGSAYLARMGAYTAIFVPLGLSCLMTLLKKRYVKVLQILIIGLYFMYWFYEIRNSVTLYEFEWFFGK